MLSDAYPTLVVMVEPVSFYANPVTAVTNSYQHVAPDGVAHQSSESDAAIREHRVVAMRLAHEFRVDVVDISARNDDVVKLMELPDSHDAQVRAADDDIGHHPLANKPDAVFPNNSFSLHVVGSVATTTKPFLVVLYPMSPGRRDEIPQCLISSWLRRVAEGTLTLLDLRSLAEGTRALEGTGAINFTHDGAALFVSLSSRADRGILMNSLLCRENESSQQETHVSLPVQDVFVFDSTDEAGFPVYHTNVVGWTGRGVCAWCWESVRFDTDAERQRCEAYLTDVVCEGNASKFIKLTRAQMRQFCGNCIEIVNLDGIRLLCMSETAWTAYTAEQQDLLIAHYGGREHIAVFAIPTVERLGGGSLRCLLAASIRHGGTVPPCSESSPTLSLRPHFF